jgi:hypothetical protein
MILTTLLLLLSQLAGTSSPLSSAERLRARIPIEAVDRIAPVKLAGQYTSSSKELRKLVGGFLSGNDLYLFPDGTYIYCEWADIEPTTVHDKGRWGFANGLIELKSDPDVNWEPGIDRTYAAVRRASHKKEILLVGVGHDLPYFEKEAGDDPNLMLLIVAKKQKATFTEAGASKLKASLLKEAWRPESFKKGAAEAGPPHR